MPFWIPRSIFGAVIAGIYVILAVWIVVHERRRSGGGWISLQGILSYLITFPVSYPADRLGNKLDHRRNRDMAFAIIGCAVFIYLICAGLGWLAWLVFAS